MNPVVSKPFLKARASWSFITLQDGAFVKLRNTLFMWGGKKKARFSQYLMGFEASKKQIAARLKQNGGDISGG